MWGAMLFAAFSAVLAGVLPGASESPPDSPIWRGDYETGDLSQWVALQAKDSSRVSIQSDVVRQGGYAARFEVRPGDNGVASSGTGERTEVFIGDRTEGFEGHEAYWAWSTFFPTDFTAPGGAWNVFVQFHHSGSSGQANIHFAVQDMATIAMRVLGGKFNRPVRKDFVLARLRKGRWYDFIFHVGWSSSRSGFVEVWVNGSRVVRRTSTPTLYARQSVYLKQGYYRSAYDATTVVYQDGMRRASTLAEVVRSGQPAS